MPHQHSPCRIMLLLYHHIQCAALPPRHLATLRPLSGRHGSRSVSLAAVSLLWNSGGWMAHRIQGGRAGGGSRTLPTSAMHNGCSVQLCSTAEGGSGGGVGVQRGAEAAASLIKACYAPVMPEPRAAHTPYLLVVFPFLVSGFLASWAHPFPPFLLA